MTATVVVDEAQVSLFASILPNLNNITITPAMLNVAEIVDDDVGEQPSEDFIRSVLTWGGVFEPVDVRPDPATKNKKVKRYLIIEGRRRLRALRIALARQEDTELPLDTIRLEPVIPAKIIEGMNEQAGADAFALMKNRQRSDNIIFEAQALQRLFERGASETDVYRLTGLTAPEQRRRMNFFKLIKPLQKLYDEGRATIAVLESVAKLDKLVQTALHASYKQKLKDAEDKSKVRLTMEDVREVKQVRTEEASDSLDPELFETAPLAADEVFASPRPDVTVKVVNLPDALYDALRRYVDADTCACDTAGRVKGTKYECRKCEGEAALKLHPQHNA